MQAEPMHSGKNCCCASCARSAGSRVTGVREDAVWIYLCNLAPTDMIEYGHVLPKPGDEAAWFESSPASVKEYLTSLGTTEATFKL